MRPSPRELLTPGLSRRRDEGRYRSDGEGAVQRFQHGMPVYDAGDHQ
jgi:hypothetical protein